MTHSPLSPSASHRWLACKASSMMCKDLPDEPTKYASEGTDAHEIMAKAASAYLSAYDKDDAENAMSAAITAASSCPEWQSVQDSDDMLSCVKSYLLELSSTFYIKPDNWRVEWPLNIGNALGLNIEAKGFVDCYVQTGSVLHVFDYKHGRGVVVSADHNPQLMLYALALLHNQYFDKSKQVVQQSLFPKEIPEIAKVVLHIVQPRIADGIYWKTTPKELTLWRDEVASPAAKHVLELYDGKVKASPDDFKPNEDVCRFCRAKNAGTCSELEKQVFGIVQLPPEPVSAITHPVLPDDLKKLAWLFSQRDLVKQFFDAAESRVYATLAEGGQVPGFKLVQGKPGNRAWKSKEEAEQTMRRMRLHKDDMYDSKVISPTSAEKLFKAGKLGPRKWAELQALITRPEGKPMIAPESDSRPALEFKPFREITDNDALERPGG